MNRVIKFRAWTHGHWSDRGMLYDYGNTTLVESCGWDSFPVMQFTGLKDKSGKEIYEGDICEFMGARYVVAWGDQLMGFYTYMTPKHTGHFLQNQNMRECAVIGNIHENPELLINP